MTNPCKNNFMTKNAHTPQNNPQCLDIAAIIPAAGIGTRMGGQCPKQYLPLGQATILEHTVKRLLSHSAICEVVIALKADDPYFQHTGLDTLAKVKTTIGGDERVDSVLAALKQTQAAWVMVHDAARPCVNLEDIERLIQVALKSTDGAILATPVTDTIKYSTQGQYIEHTKCRKPLWQALTPQMFQREQLIHAIESALAANQTITDDASAIEFLGGKPALVQGSRDNIKITQPEDLAWAQFLLMQHNQQESI